MTSRLPALCAAMTLCACGMADISQPVKRPLDDTQKLDPNDPKTDPNGDPFIEGGSGGGGGGGTGTPTGMACADGGIVTTIYEFVASSQTITSGERIGDGPGGNPMTSSMGCAPCQPGEVAVIDQSPYGDAFKGIDPALLPPDVQNRLGGGGTICAPPPPTTCANDTFPTFVPVTEVLVDGVQTGGTNPAHWQCAGPCELLIQYGAMFGNRLVCAPKPTSTTCTGGQTETFDLNSETWQCQTSCSGGTYDPATLNGVQVCVPC